VGQDRLEWLDAAKGVAILAIVLGHVVPDRNPFYWWHIPCFYVITGYTLRTGQDATSYAKRRAAQLLVPYLVWLCLLSAPDAWRLAQHVRPSEITHFVEIRIFGGQKLQPPVSTYWFLTSLFLSCVLFQFLSRRLTGRALAWACAASYVLAILRQFLLPRLAFPLECDSVLIALPFLYVGCRLREVQNVVVTRVVWVGSVAFVFLLVAYCAHMPIPTFDVKNADYGRPAISWFIALAGTGGCFAIARGAGVVRRPLAFVGRASILVMLVHQAVIVLLVSLGQASWPVLFLTSSLVPLGLFAVLDKHPISRRYLLGHLPREAGTPISAR
jgi:fucose 4-O-acetylase-like acetyltransferase